MRITEEDRKTTTYIAVVGPRHKGNYDLILGAVIRAIDLVRRENEHKDNIIFVHDGVTSGSTGEVVEVVNKISESMLGYGYTISYKKMPLDIEMYGKRSQHEWVERAAKLDVDLFLILDDKEAGHLQHARRIAYRNSIDTLEVEVRSDEIKRTN